MQHITAITMYVQVFCRTNTSFLQIQEIYRTNFSPQYVIEHVVCDIEYFVAVFDAQHAVKVLPVAALKNVFSVLLEGL